MHSPKGNIRTHKCRLLPVHCVHPVPLIPGLRYHSGEKSLSKRHHNCYWLLDDTFKIIFHTWQMTLLPGSGIHKWYFSFQVSWKLCLMLRYCYLHHVHYQLLIYFSSQSILSHQMSQNNLSSYLESPSKSEAYF